MGPKSPNRPRRSRQCQVQDLRLLVLLWQTSGTLKKLNFSEKENGVFSDIARSTSGAMRRSSSSNNRCGRKPAAGLPCYFYHVPALLFHLLVVSSRCTPVSASKGRAQIVRVSAPWPTSCLSPLAEASEFVTEGDGGGSGGGATGGGGGLFWDYVEAVGDAPHWVFSCSRGSSAGQGDTETGEASPPSTTAAASSSATATTSSSSPAEGGGEVGNEKEDEPNMAWGGSTLQRSPAAAIDEAAAVSVAAVRAAGEGFGPGGSGGSGGDGGSGALAPGLGLDELSLRLLEVALSAR